MIVLAVKIVAIAFFLNLLYELLHSLLYETCLRAPLPRYVYLILKGAVFDGIVIGGMYYLTAQAGATALFIQSQPLQIILFTVIAIIFAYAWEIYSLKAKKW